ncbi:bifunctional adenosylcobinamide kinase/adenosylcobinamide-phosphate guanylyltransferase [Oceanobacter mangrovi]|uniref:bifunctional adenosylcobinamide kinase/adenosylcobinamide-phosphate guanylyltransferase n=1 Tax=Oceanobacter mangrovi TaxID=2862510 RepID=UPI001C8E0B21|nr:bifunctional adenosylcobinamide kinase/adenosylcobinamide-phosphate guanylyltransferase [Oceanobacter mangrovi]
MIHLIIGGARSGKSSFALQQANQRAAVLGYHKQFVATATPFDAEMQARIERHQQERGADWSLAEVPLQLAEHLVTANAGSVLLIDCLTLWLNNRLYLWPDADFEQLSDPLLSALASCPADVLLIANEVGLGVIPMGEETRRFVDYAGWLNQAVARLADQVTLVSAGLPLVLKPMAHQ